MLDVSLPIKDIAEGETGNIIKQVLIIATGYARMVV
jgi:hypothetical protein